MLGPTCLSKRKRLLKIKAAITKIKVYLSNIKGGWGGNQGGWGGNQGGWGGNQGGMGFFNQQSEQNFGNNAEGQQWIEQQKKMNDYNIVNPNQQQNINNLMGEQIVFIEPSPAQQRLEELKRTGQPFIDDRFPAN